MTTELVRATRSDLDAVASTLVDAFANDSLTKALGLPDRITRRMYTVPAILGFANGEVIAASDAFEGVMVVMDGEHSVFGMGQLIRAGAVGEAPGAGASGKGPRRPTAARTLCSCRRHRACDLPGNPDRRQRQHVRALRI